MRFTSIATMIIATVAAGSALGGARQDAKVLMSSDPTGLKIEGDWGFCDAIITGDTVYLSGVVAGVRDGETGHRGCEEELYKATVPCLDGNSCIASDSAERHHRDQDHREAEPVMGQPEVMGALPWSNVSSGRIRNDNSTPRIINTASHTNGSSQFWKRSIR